VRRYFAAGIWLALTVAATLIVWTAVSVVAADVTDRPAPVVAHHDVIVALAGGSATTTTSTTSGSAPPTTRIIPLTTVPRATKSPSPTLPRAAISTPTNPVPTTVTPTSPTTRPPVRPAAPPTTVAPAGATATYSTTGGVLVVACTGYYTIRLVAALPNDGYQALVLTAGPNFVSVDFATSGRSLLVSAACFFGQPFEYTNQSGPPPGG
jgi:cytoskeletal protein RodZ